MLKTIFNAVAKNQTAQALLMAAPASMAMYLIRDMPGRIWDFGVKHKTLKLKITSGNSRDYAAIVKLATQSIIWTRDYTADDEFDTVAGYGTHYGKYKGTYIKIDRSLDSGATEWFRETCTITFLTRDINIVNSFVEDAAQFTDKKTLSILTNENNYWSKMGPLGKRDLNTVIYRDKDKLIDFIRKFEESEEEFLSKGLPYHAGILFHGEPGTGKTSLIAALANSLGRNIHYLNPSKLGKNSIVALLGDEDWTKSFLVIEDIDVSGAPTDRKEHEGLQLSELLNTLDGLLTPHGMITIATTNDLAALDPALIRPGRFDFVLEIGRLNEEEAKELGRRFNAEIPQPYSPMTGAELRNYFLKA